MRRPWRGIRIIACTLAACVLAACGPKIANERPSTDVTRHLPATLEASRPREGDPKIVKVRIYADAGIRALPKWREELNDQVDYASQLLTPLAGVRLSIESVKDWNRTSDPYASLAALVELDKGADVGWVIGYVTAGDKASKAMSELGAGEPLGRHVIVRGWAEKAETTALASSLPDLDEGARVEVLAAHRRHKQTVILLHWLAATLGAIDEADPAWIQHPSYSTKQAGFSDRNRELLQLGFDERVLGTTDQNLAKKLLEAIDKGEFGGWIPTSHEEVTKRLRNVIDASRAGKIAAAVPAAAYDQYSRIRQLALQGKPKDALVELDNLLLAYPGNAAMHQLKCEILIASSGVADAGTKAACKKAGDLAPGDPSPHLAVAQAHAAAKDWKAARVELQQAEAKVGNLPTGAEDAWKKLVGMYHGMGALTWTEEAIAKAKLEGDPIAAKVAEKRARYGIPRGAKFVAADQEAALVTAIQSALNLVYASKYGEAERAIAGAEKKWPGAPGLAAARCDLALRLGQTDGARAACARAVAADPNASWALYLSGVISLKTAAGTKQGIEQLKKAIAVDPELGQAWRTLGKAYMRAKDKAAYEQLAADYAAKFGTPLPP